MLLGAGNGLSPDWRQAIAWTNTDLLFNRNLEKDLENGIDIEICVRQVRLSLSSADDDHFVQVSMSWCRYLPYIYIYI